MAHDHTHATNEPHPKVGHVVSPRILLTVFTALIILTVLTVAARSVDLGPANIYIAIGIALVKAAMVALYFMHLRWDNPVNGMILIASLLFVALFIVFALTDTKSYSPDFVPPPSLRSE